MSAPDRPTRGQVDAALDRVSEADSSTDNIILAAEVRALRAELEHPPAEGGAPVDAATVDRVATAVHRTLLDADLRIVVKTGGGSDWGAFGTYEDQLLALVRELMRVGLVPVPSEQVLRAAMTPDASSRWVVVADIGGYVCGGCGTPTESEPCPEHQPREYARIGTVS